MSFVNGTQWLQKENATFNFPLALCKNTCYHWKHHKVAMFDLFTILPNCASVIISSYSSPLLERTSTIKRAYSVSRKSD